MVVLISALWSLCFRNALVFGEPGPAVHFFNIIYICILFNFTSSKPHCPAVKFPFTFPVLVFQALGVKLTIQICMQCSHYLFTLVAKCWFLVVGGSTLLSKWSWELGQHKLLYLWIKIYWPFSFTYCSIVLFVMSGCHVNK